MPFDKAAVPTGGAVLLAGAEDPPISTPHKQPCIPAGTTHPHKLSPTPGCLKPRGEPHPPRSPALPPLPREPPPNCPARKQSPFEKGCQAGRQEQPGWRRGGMGVQATGRASINSRKPRLAWLSPRPQPLLPRLKPEPPRLGRASVQGVRG